MLSVSEISTSIPSWNFIFESGVPFTILCVTMTAVSVLIWFLPRLYRGYGSLTSSCVLLRGG